MHDAQVQAVSRSYQIFSEKPLTGRKIREELAVLITHLARNFNYKGKIIGHIKAIAEAGENYIQLSMTDLAGYNIRTDSCWYDNLYCRLELTVNVIIAGFGREQIERVLQEGMADTVFATN